MPKLSPVPHELLVRIFKADGYEFDRQRGSHVVLTKPGTPRPVIVPTYNAVGLDIIRGLMRTANMSRERYFELMDKCR